MTWGGESSVRSVKKKRKKVFFIPLSNAISKDDNKKGGERGGTNSAAFCSR